MPDPLTLTEAEWRAMPRRQRNDFLMTGGKVVARLEATADEWAAMGRGERRKFKDRGGVVL